MLPQLCVQGCPWMFLQEWCLWKPRLLRLQDIEKAAWDENVGGRSQPLLECRQELSPKCSTSPPGQSLWHSPYPGTAVGQVELLLSYLWYFLSRSSLALSWTLFSCSLLVLIVHWLLICCSSLFSLGLPAVTKPNILPPCTTHSLSNCMLLCVSVFDSCHVSCILLPLLSYFAFWNSI